MDCLNCQAQLPGGPPFPRFCLSCGQPTPLHRAEPRAAVLRVLRTLWALLFRPGFLTLEWVAGRRQRYVLPRPLLAASMLALVVVVKLAPVPLWVAAPPSARPAGEGDQRIARDLAGPVKQLDQARWPLADAARRSLVTLGQGLVLQARADGDAGFFRRVVRVFVTVIYYSSFITFPLQAAYLWLAFRGSGLPYRQHLVYAMHSSSSWALFLCLAYLSPSPLLAAGLMAAAGIRSSLEIRRAYGDAYRPWRRKLMLFLLLQLAVLPLQWLALWCVAFGLPF